MGINETFPGCEFCQVHQQHAPLRQAKAFDGARVRRQEQRFPPGDRMAPHQPLPDRLEGFKRDVNRATDGIFAGCRRGSHKAARWGHGSARTGNVAFDDWREKELERLAEERRKLDEMLSQFDDYAREDQFRDGTVERVIATVRDRDYEGLMRLYKIAKAWRVKHTEATIALGAKECGK